jgi:hypothetical protein
MKQLLYEEETVMMADVVNKYLNVALEGFRSWLQVGYGKKRFSRFSFFFLQESKEA